MSGRVEEGYKSPTQCNEYTAARGKAAMVRMCTPVPNQTLCMGDAS